MWNIIRAILWMWLFFEKLLQFLRFEPKRGKNRKITVLTKWKMTKIIYYFKDSTTYFKYHIFPYHSINFLILLVCFVVLNVLGYFFYGFIDFHVFQYCEKCFSLNAKRFNIVSISQLKKNFLSNKRPVQRL